MIGPGADAPAGRADAELTIVNAPEELAAVSAWLGDQTRRCGLSPRCAHRTEVAVVEAVTNVISYAHDERGRHPIGLRLRCREGWVEVEVADDGRPFNPLERPLPDAPADLDTAPVGGLGITLIRRSTDACDYRREGGRNVLTLGNRTDQ